MFLFSAKWRGTAPVVYFDLDTVICNSLQPLYDHALASPSQLSICASFTGAVSASWSCLYGSCVMTFGEGLPEDVWNTFQEAAVTYMHAAGRYGDQKVFERLYPNARLLRQELPPNYFIGYRDLYKYPTGPDDGAIVVYAGGRTPKTFGPPWVLEIWNTSSL